jgi:ketosteroid isomerase-like protein
MMGSRRFAEEVACMKSALWMVLCLVMSLCPPAFCNPCPTGQAKDEATLIQIEQTWARALEEQDVGALMCILADEFEDAGPTGALADRSKILARADSHRGVHHELSELHAHIYGDVAYIRGVARAAAAKNVPGAPPMVVRFTDVYVYRDGRWQCVAGHESSFPRPATM